MKGTMNSLTFIEYLDLENNILMEPFPLIGNKDLASAEIKYNNMTSSSGPPEPSLLDSNSIIDLRSPRPAVGREYSTAIRRTTNASKDWETSFNYSSSSPNVYDGPTTLRYDLVNRIRSLNEKFDELISRLRSEIDAVKSSQC